MPQLDIATYSAQIAWLVTTFGALFLIMWRVAVPKISDTLEARQKRIDDYLNKAGDFKRDAEAAIKAYEESLADARSAAHAAIAEAQTTLAEEAATRDAELNDKLKAMLSESEANISKAVDDAMDNVREVAQEVSAAAVERLLGESMEAGDVAAAVDNAMKTRA